LPADPLARAWVRGLALINVADSHPLIVPRVRHYLTDVLKVSDDQRLAWIQHWLGAGLQAIETLLAEHPASGRFCHGESPTVADMCLVTQVTPAMTLRTHVPNDGRLRSTYFLLPTTRVLIEPIDGDHISTTSPGFRKRSGAEVLSGNNSLESAAVPAAVPPLMTSPDRA
jgi:hypothetical protein